MFTIGLPHDSGRFPINDSDGRRIASAYDPASAELITTALNNYLNNGTRRTDPQTSRDAERSVSQIMKNRYRRLAVELYEKHGAMSDEELYQQFVLSDVAITIDRVQHIRLELWRCRLLVELTEKRKTSTGRECRVFELMKPETTSSHD